MSYKEIAEVLAIPIGRSCRAFRAARRNCASVCNRPCQGHSAPHPPSRSAGPCWGGWHPGGIRCLPTTRSPIWPPPEPARNKAAQPSFPSASYESKTVVQRFGHVRARACGRPSRRIQPHRPRRHSQEKCP
ncbi:MAG: hypothetical protein ABMA26_01110 [Limisphaerales bacterium]